MKSISLLLFSLLFSVSAFTQNGVYLFGSMNNAPGTTFDISVVIYSTPPVTTQFTVNPDGSITNTQNYWVDLPSSDWTHFEVIYPTCENETNILTVVGDSLPNMIDVFYEVDFCPSGNAIFGCTDPEALNFDPNANQDDGSCLYNENPGCVDVDLEVFCIDTLSNAYDLTISEDPFCCNNSWDQLCQQSYESFGGQPLPGCANTDIWGCTDPNAINYNPNANLNDGSCEYETECTWVTMVLDGPSNNQGFFDLYAGNGFVATGTYGGSDQTYEWCLEDGCYEMYFVLGNGQVINDGVFYTIFMGDSIIDGGTFMNQTSLINFGINANCDSFDVYGCTDPEAINYNPNATSDDGSCEYNNEVENDLCANATTLQLGSQSISNIGADNNENIWGECWAFGSGEGEQSSIWYTFTTPDEPATIHIEASGDGTNTLTDTQFGLFEECGGEMIYCDGNAGQGLFSAFHFECGELEENTTYILMIDGYFGDSGTCNLTYDVTSFCDVLGCTDPEAINYDPNATVDDGSCEYETECTWVSMVLDGPSNNQGFFDLYSDNGYVASGTYGGSDQVYEWCLEDGCYEMYFVMNNGDVFDNEVVYTIFMGDSIIDGGAFTSQTSLVNFGVNASCDSTGIYGCTDPDAINYNPNATVDDGSCTYNEPCTNVTISFNSLGVYQGFWDIYNENNYVTGGTYGGGPMPNSVCLEDGCYDLLFVMSDATVIDTVAYSIAIGDSIITDGIFTQLTSQISFGVNTSCEEEVLGCTDPEAINYAPNATIDDGSCEYEEVPCETNEVLLVINTDNWGNEVSWKIRQDGLEIAGDWGYDNGSTYTYPLCLEDDCYLFEMFDSFGDGWNGGTFSITLDGMVLAEGTLQQGEYDAIEFGVNTECGGDEQIFGCTDPNALNYNAEATIDDGSCEYESECTPITMVLDGPSINQGFFDLYSDNGYVINGTYGGSDQVYEWCLEDGCYELFFVMNSGGTVINEVYYTLFQGDSIIGGGTFMNQTSLINFGVNANCDSTEVYGCTDPTATNYNPNATMDDGSCEYDQDCVAVGDEYCVDTDSEAYFVTITQDSFCCNNAWDQICQNAYIDFGGPIGEDCGISGCTDPNAINYNPNATIDDGTCEYQFECAISFTVSPDSTGAQVIWITPTSNIANAAEVEWDFGDGTTSNDLFPVHVYEGDGPYTLCLTAYFEEPNGGFCEITYCAVLTDEMLDPPGMQSSGFSINVLNPNVTTGVDELMMISGLNLWPNPASDQANIEFTLLEGTNVNIEVFDVTGKMVAGESISAGTGNNFHPIDVSNLRPGMYVVRLTGEAEQMTTRMVIQ